MNLSQISVCATRTHIAVLHDTYSLTANYKRKYFQYLSPGLVECHVQKRNNFTMLCEIYTVLLLYTSCWWQATQSKKKKKKIHDNQNSTKCCIQFLANPWILTCSTRGGPLASRNGGKHQPCCMPASLTFFFFLTVTSLASMANSLLTYKWTIKLQSVCAVKFRQYSDNTQHG